MESLSCLRSVLLASVADELVEPSLGPPSRPGGDQMEQGHLSQSDQGRRQRWPGGVRGAMSRTPLGTGLRAQEVFWQCKVCGVKNHIFGLCVGEILGKSCGGRVVLLGP